MPHREPLHVPHEVMEGGHVAGPSRADRLLELGAVLVLSVTLVATAWSGYQAALWSGEQSKLYTEASGLRVKSAEEATLAGQARIDDLLYFNHWLDAYKSGGRELATIYRRRFRPEFVPAFRAWMAQKPFSNPDAIPGPLYMPQYRPAALERAAEHNEHAEELFREGIEAKEHDDDYILSTVFFAMVLFFAGVSMRLDWLRLRVVVFGLSFLLLVGGLGFVLSLPNA
jgi:hypothetical protein